jgi:hypothetical protein
MYGAKVTISDPTPPTLSTPTGTLWEPSETGFHTGTQSVTIAATDIGGGVQSIELAADDHPLQAYTASCDFTHPQPCPNTTGTQNFTLPTTQLSDGTHTLTLTATDAAGNKTTTSQQITIANNPPPPPIELTATPTEPGSTTFTATWADPIGQVAPITAATYQICSAYGLDTCGSPTTAPFGGPAAVTALGPGTWTLAVWLSNAAGLSSPGNAAHTTLTVPTPTSAPSATLGSDSSDGGSSDESRSPAPSHPDPPKKGTIHLAETLRGHELVVHVSGPATGTVRVSYTGRYRGRTIARAAKTVALANGHVTVRFELTAFTAVRAKVRVSAISHGAAATSTLRRRHR